ncbi:4-hydroxybenzoate 3-monooxygenase [Kocuria sp. p3-SID1433]|uniref:4-hydroxybenzoate 3-monooxygenase n=1 Tax=unclassified Kocuria TaxID=2649579 RepID=UPI0021A73E99|nr:MULTISPECIES: 4-hydroxybenzoate 3-monooxygenase [unclassified Kocuria]MCT1602477.1 4-hydroxybenzoate 3-monooxygenase [Kocuria sp. p3-SID1428]MCT2180803.1 4-hydroxybenzoate 3-monooxygenase [Kocuria sp. p3-SID1433]
MSQHAQQPASPAPELLETQVAVVGAGPAGLMLAHLLRREGIETMVIEKRDPESIRATHRAGILEAGTVDMLVDSGVAGRVLTEGHEHQGTSLRFEGRSHHIDFQGAVGRSVWLYPQNEVFWDLKEASERDGGTVFWSADEVAVHDVDSDRPGVTFIDSEGAAREIRSRILVGADGSRSVCRKAIPEDVRTDHFTEYPFAWFGILCQAPPSHHELIYTRSEAGFALISQRSGDVQRMYFQCDPAEDPEDWTDEQIWTRLQECVSGPDGFRLKEGPIIEKTVLPFRSYVCEPLRHGSLVLVGDAGHTVPPTGAKGLNLAFCDVRVLAPALVALLRDGAEQPLAGYSAAALERVWKAQNFSYWVTRMLHRSREDSEFDSRRQLGELHAITDSPYGRAYFADSYTGWQS